MSQFDRACRDFAITYLITAIAMILLARQLATAGIAISAFSGMVPMALAGCLAGFRHGERTGRRPDTALSWAFALYGTATAIIISICLVIVMLMAMEPAVRTAVEAVMFQPAFIGMILVIAVTVHVLTLRYSFQAAAACGGRLISRRTVSA